MINIMKRQILEGLKDAKYIFLTALVILAFIINAFVYAERYHQQVQDYNDNKVEILNNLERRTDNLQVISNYQQNMMLYPNPLAFIADGGQLSLPNSLQVNAFQYTDPQAKSRNNEMLPVMEALDWSFIVGVLMTLLAVLISFGVICGEKRDGTLRLVLANSIPRSKIFFGKYLGLMSIMLVTLLLGILVNLTILYFVDALPVNELILTQIGWSVLLSVFCISLILLLGMAVSAMVKTPAIALVILIIGWVLNVVAVPGLARMIAEQVTTVKPNYKVLEEIEKGIDDVHDSLPRNAGSWNGDPFAPFVKDRARYQAGQVRVVQTHTDAAHLERIEQSKMINILSSVAPSGLLKYSMQEGCNTGIFSFELLQKMARRYRDQLYEYTANLDKMDKDSPHHVTSWGSQSDDGMFSTQEVSLSTFPRYDALWEADNLAKEIKFPWVQLLVFFLGNLQVGLLAFIFIARYDPR